MYISVKAAHTIVHICLFGTYHCAFLCIRHTPLCISTSEALFINPTDAHNYKITGMLKEYRTPAHSLICRHDIDHVINDEHNRTTKHEIVP